MKLDAYVKTVLTVIAVALVAIAAHLWSVSASPAPAHAQTPDSALEHVSKRLAALEQTQKEHATRLEALRSALQSTVTNATGRGYYPDRNWSTIYWYPDAAPNPGS